MKKIMLYIGLFIIINVSSSYSFIDTEAEVAVVIDADTGHVLFDKNKDKKTYPASMTKIMTVLVIFEKLKNGTLRLDDKFVVSEKAWKEREGSSMFVEVGKEIRVEDLLRGIIIQSGNDACIVVAEEIAGSEESFAFIMNDMAKDIGLKNTNFSNSTGMYNKNNYSTAYDLAIMSQYLINNYPEHYHLFSEKDFEWSGIAQKNRNSLLYKSMGVDGLKTGHLSVSGYGLAASAVEDGRRLISVTNGFNSSQKRSQGSARLLTWGFREFDNIKIASLGDEIGLINVSSAKGGDVSLISKTDIKVTASKAYINDIKTKIILNENVKAPIKLHTPIARLEVYIPKQEKIYFDLLSKNDVKAVGLIERFINFIINLFSIIFS